MARFNVNQVLLAMALMPSTLGHLCVWSPMQRGDFSIATPGSHDCYRKDGPCGGEDAGTEITSLDGGSSFLVQFQQNLNHYTTDDPGSLVIDYAIGSNPSEEDFIGVAGGEEFADYNAMNMITQTNFSRYITVPDTDAANAVLRVRYISNNPEENDRGETFYQCSDISITSSMTSGKTITKSVDQEDKQVEKQSIFKLDPTKIQEAGDDSNSCCAPETFKIDYFYSNPDGTGTIWYDATVQQMRVDFDTTAGASHSMYINFTSGIEWYVDNSDGTCEEYGCDDWIEWCFGGEEYSETYVGAGPCGEPVNEDCLAFKNGDWMFAATADQCYPAAIAPIGSNSGNGPRYVEYYSPDASSIPYSTFVAPCTAPSTPRHSNLRNGDNLKKLFAPHHLPSVLATPHAHKNSHSAGKKN